MAQIDQETEWVAIQLTAHALCPSTLYGPSLPPNPPPLSN